MNAVEHNFRCSFLIWRFHANPLKPNEAQFKNSQRLKNQ